MVRQICLTVALKSDIPTVPTKTSDLQNDSGFITSSALSGYATETWVGQQGFITSSALSGYATETWVGQQGFLTSVSWNDVLNKPTFSTVATSGSYTDLTDKPTIPTDTAQLTKSDIYTKAETFTRQEIVDMINEINYSDLNNLPTIPTATSQLTLDTVYSKSEIDTQINDLSNQIGNINNLLETI